MCRGDQRIGEKGNPGWTLYSTLSMARNIASSLYPSPIPTNPGPLRLIIHSQLLQPFDQSTGPSSDSPKSTIFFLDQLYPSPLCSGITLPHSTALFALLQYTLIPHPLACLHSLLYTRRSPPRSARSTLTQTALPRPNLPNDETKSRSLNFRIW